MVPYGVTFDVPVHIGGASRTFGIMGPRYRLNWASEDSRVVFLKYFFHNFQIAIKNPPFFIFRKREGLDIPTPVRDYLFKGFIQ